MSAATAHIARVLADTNEVDELDLIERAIYFLQEALYALNRSDPATSTGRSYVDEARLVLAKVPQ